MVDRKAVPKAKLNDGNYIPLIGYGSSSVRGEKPGDPGYDAIKFAIKAGYEFIDTAALYQNEKEIGQAIRECIDEGLVKREDLYICTKVWCAHHKRASVMKACKESLARLGLDYVDLYLIHWPVAYVEDGDPINPLDPKTGRPRYSDTHYTETWQGMEDCKDAGLAKSIGVSNFNHKMIQDILSIPCKYSPAVNQVEIHPYLSQEKLLEHSKKYGIILNAYCPLGSPGDSCKPGQPVVLEDPVILEIAKKYNKSPAQILVRHQVQRNISAIPKSVTPSRIAENIDVLDFTISKEDQDRILSINRNLRYCISTGGYEVHDHPLYPFHIEY